MSGRFERADLLAEVQRSLQGDRKSVV